MVTLVKTRLLIMFFQNSTIVFQNDDSQVFMSSCGCGMSISRMVSSGSSWLLVYEGGALEIVESHHDPKCGPPMKSF